METEFTYPQYLKKEDIHWLRAILEVADIRVHRPVWYEHRWVLTYR